MTLLADENIERAIIVRLRAEGYVVLAIAESQPGITDSEVLRLAVQQQSVLLTGDKDFGDLIFLHRLPAPLGVLLLRLPESMTSAQKADIVANVMSIYAAQLSGTFTVVSLQGVRIVPLPTSP